MTITDGQYRQLLYYREEVRHEFSLLTSRSTILVTCQSFLIVPFAILNSTASFRAVVVPAALIVVLGAYTSWVIRAPILASHGMLDEWMRKQRVLLAAVEDDAFKTWRDEAPGVAETTAHDRVHQRSIAFSRTAPIAFFIFWLCAGAFVAVRAAVGF
jgi:hypothetical protein